MRFAQRRRDGDGGRASCGSLSPVALALLVALLAVLALSPAASAVANPEEMLIYMPYGLIHNLHPAAEVDEYVAEVSAYDIGQVVFAMPKFKPTTGTVKVPKHNAEMLALYAREIAAYNAQHGTDLTLTAVFNGKVRTRKSGLDLEDAATRANVVAAVEASLGLGITGVQLDLEPTRPRRGLSRCSNSSMRRSRVSASTAVCR